MQSAYAGETFSPTFTVTTGGTFTVRAVDALGRQVSASVSESAGTATVTIAAGSWGGGASGYGRIEVMRESSGVKTVEASERVRILPGLAVEATDDYTS